MKILKGKAFRLKKNAVLFAELEFLENDFLKMWLFAGENDF